mgnify:CR=1 FL=1
MQQRLTRRGLLGATAGAAATAALSGGTGTALGMNSSAAAKGPTDAALLPPDRIGLRVVAGFGAAGTLPGSWSCRGGGADASGCGPPRDGALVHIPSLDRPAGQARCRACREGGRARW